MLEATLEAMAPALAERGVRVTNDVPADLPPLRVDGFRFRKLFELLLRDELLNAPANLEVRFTAVWKAAESGGEGEIELQVWDNGPGLPPEAVLSVLDPLVSRSAQAADLGLNLMACYFIVYHHGGRIRLQPGRPRPGLPDDHPPGASDDGGSQAESAGVPRARDDQRASVGAIAGRRLTGLRPTRGHPRGAGGRAEVR